MKLYTGLGTNSQVVRHFARLKGVTLAEQWVDIATGENRAPAFLAKNSLGQVPVLELASGQCISQVTAICEYLEDEYPSPPLIGRSAEEKAETRMWLRRLDLLILEPLVSAFRYGPGLPYYQKLQHCIPGASAELKLVAEENLAWLNRELAGRSSLCRGRFTLADIMLFAFVEFAGAALALAITGEHLIAWQVAARHHLATGA
ncbi:glutathione S-transferase family protein [Halioxenophilus sp. WMMB6]|uniref:glutathione S-transferase family protein n=1 Tax=Halioxenophilus sp. WMMB6 TaxID=3073815 RepID=UPI00295F2142|nr:glutathione S-transferase family protein [Halioxenophilus sp. WMMB6]